MNMPRIELVRFRLPKQGHHHILVRFVDGRLARFYKGQMLQDMKRLGMLRLKIAIIHDKAYLRAMKGSMGASSEVQELLAEFHQAAEDFGVDLSRIRRREE